MALTLEQAEKEHNAALAHSEEQQARWLKGNCSFDELAAARQMAAHLGGRLEAMKDRDAKRAQQAQDDAREKNLREANTRKGKAELAKADALILAGENLGSSLLDALDTCAQYEVDPVYFALGLLVETFQRQENQKQISKLGATGSLDRVKWEFTKGGQPLKEARNARAQAVKKLAENNGHTTKGSTK